MVSDGELRQFRLAARFGYKSLRFFQLRERFTMALLQRVERCFCFRQFILKRCYFLIALLQRRFSCFTLLTLIVQLVCELRKTLSARFSVSQHGFALSEFRFTLLLVRFPRSLRSVKLLHFVLQRLTLLMQRCFK